MTAPIDYQAIAAQWNAGETLTLESEPKSTPSTWQRYRQGRLYDPARRAQTHHARMQQRSVPVELESLDGTVIYHFTPYRGLQRVDTIA